MRDDLDVIRKENLTYQREMRRDIGGIREELRALQAGIDRTNTRIDRILEA